MRLLQGLLGLVRDDPPPEKRGTCLKCRRKLPSSSLIFVNHCYHEDKDYGHTGCAGIRALCLPCHDDLDGQRAAYYLSLLAEKERQNPDQYPWQQAREGLRRSLERMVDG